MPKENSVPEVMSEKEIAQSLGGEIVKQDRVFSDDEARDIASWSDIQNLLNEKDYVSVLVDEVLGDGFTVMSTDDKRRLVGAPMHILDWQFHDGNMGPFVSARVIVKTGEKDDEIQKWRIADGSAGVYRDLLTLSSKLGRSHSVTVRRGLRPSDYDVEIDTPNGPKTIPATTYYLDLGK